MKKKTFFWFISLIYGSGLVLVSLAAHWPQELWWLANAISVMPLWILGIPLMVLAVIALGQRWLRLFAAQVLLGIILLIGIMEWTVPMPKGHLAGGDRVKIMSINLGTVTHPHLKSFLDQWKPDIIVFQEGSPEDKDYLKSLMPSGTLWDSHEDYYLGVISRFPILHAEVKSRQLVGGWGHFVHRYALQAPFGIINLFDVHLETPREGVEALMAKKWRGIEDMDNVTRQQDAESFLASQWARGYSNVVVAGDFNMPSSNPIFYKYWSFLTDAFSKTGAGFGYTKLTRRHGVRIDHILADRNWKAVDFMVGPDVGSDHRPIAAELIFKGEKQSVTAPAADDSFVSKISGIDDLELPVSTVTVSQAAKTEGAENYSGKGTLTIRGTLSEETNVVGLAWDVWNIDTYHQVSFAYKAWPGTPVAIRVKTQFDDWICIAATADASCEGAKSPKSLLLAADNQWHTVTVDIRGIVRSSLKSLKYLKEWQWMVFPGGDNVVWIKEFLISGYKVK